MEGVVRERVDVVEIYGAIIIQFFTAT